MKELVVGLGLEPGVSLTEPAHQFKVLLQLRKLSHHRLVEAPHSVIPNLFRDLGFEKPGLGVADRGLERAKELVGR